MTSKRAEMLEELYGELNKREYVHPDPLEFLYEYESPGDVEVVALVASSLAFGRVAQILKSVRTVLNLMGPHPRSFLMGVRTGRLRESLKGFKHRIYTGRNVAAMLTGAKRMLEEHGSLGAGFGSGVKSSDTTVLPALDVFVRNITGASDGDCGSLMSDPSRGSACKRLNLMLRWLVRRDEVDPGGWSCVTPSMLVVPLDVHMHRIGLAMGLTTRKSADLRAALDVTEGYRRFCPDDPVKYDFALTRLGIRDDMQLSDFLDRCAEDLH